MATRKKAGYMISAIAEQYEVHPQTLRMYEREGLLRPARTEGNTRLYDAGTIFCKQLDERLGIGAASEVKAPKPFQAKR